MLEGVQTNITNNDPPIDNDNDLILVHQENNILFPNFKRDNQVERLVIAYGYCFVLNAPPPEEWDGVDGSLSKVCAMFH